LSDLRLKNGMTIRPASADDAPALHALIAAHVEEGHLLPRQLSELERHASRFVVAEKRGRLHACAELAPLSDATAEVRSLVVSESFRGKGLAARLVEELRDRASANGFDTLSAFTHDARFFVRQGFSIVPHLSVPEKITTDCVNCPLFRRCSQYAMVLPLNAPARYSGIAERQPLVASVA